MKSFFNLNPESNVNNRQITPRTLFILAILLLAIIPIINLFYIFPKFTSIPQKNAIRASIILAKYFQNTFDLEQLTSVKELDVKTIHDIQSLKEAFNLMKIKFFTPEGIIYYSTVDGEIGKIASSKTEFDELVAKGEIFHRLQDNIRSNGRIIIETYVPFMKDGKFIGATEIYFDITDSVNDVTRQIVQAELIIMVVFLVLTALFSIIFYRNRRSELALQRSERLLHLIVNNAMDIIYHIQIRPSIKITYVSAAIIKISGYTPEEFYNNPDTIYKLTVSEDIPQLQKALSGNLDFSKTIYQRCVTKDSKLIYLEHRIVPIKNSNGLLTAIEGIARDVTEKYQMEERLEYLSLNDPLTGLHNRLYFEQQLSAWESDILYPATIILCDIDGLKLFNDSFGHEVGDKILLASATIIKNAIPSSAIIARIGGDEFGILLKSSDKKIIDEFKQRLQESIMIYNHNQAMLPLSISVGYAIRKEPSIHMRHLFRTADNNMYREKLQRDQSTRSSIVHTLKKAMEARDFNTEGHATRLEELVTLLATELNSPEINITDLRLFAQFHDIGKVGIPDHILFKPGSFESNELQVMRRHCEIGYRIALASPDLTLIADWILKHHEWWNGQGYPLGLKGEEIPLECRILTIVDAFDAMVSDRPYRKALSHIHALEEVKKCSGIQFDPELVRIFIQIMERHLQDILMKQTVTTLDLTKEKIS